MRVLDEAGSIMEAVSKFMLDLFDSKTCENLSRTFAQTRLSEQHAQEVLEEARDALLRVKAGQFRRPNRVPSHTTSQKQTEPNRLAYDRVGRTDSGTLATRQTGFRAIDGAAVLNENRGFTAGLFAQAATCAVRGNFSGA
jgi:hypothetical protein